MEAEPPLIETALFYCQPAAEKAMKAFFTAHDMPFSKTHDLDEGLDTDAKEIALTLHPQITIDI